MISHWDLTDLMVAPTGGLRNRLIRSAELVVGRGEDQDRSGRLVEGSADRVGAVPERRGDRNDRCDPRIIGGECDHRSKGVADQMNPEICMP